MIITPAQIRSARAMMKWTQEDLAMRAGASINSIKNIEAEVTQARPKMLSKIRHVFDTAGLEFLPRNGVREAKDMIRVIEGEEAWLSVLDDIFQTYKDTGGVVYFFDADDRRSSKKVIEYIKMFRKHNIIIHELIADGNTYILGRLEEYRWMPKKYMSSDVTAIYGSKIAFTMSESDWPNYISHDMLIINNEHIAEDYKKKFELLWDLLPQPTHSTAPDDERY